MLRIDSSVIPAEDLPLTRSGAGIPGTRPRLRPTSIDQVGPGKGLAARGRT